MRKFIKKLQDTDYLSLFIVCVLPIYPGFLVGFPFTYLFLPIIGKLARLLLCICVISSLILAVSVGNSSDSTK